jgi:hypothetical protein
MSVELQQAYKSDQAVITTNDEKIYIDNDSNININKSQISNENISNNNLHESSEELTDNNVVKEEDISNVVPTVNNDDEE